MLGGNINGLQLSQASTYCSWIWLLLERMNTLALKDIFFIIYFKGANYIYSPCIGTKSLYQNMMSKTN